MAPDGILVVVDCASFPLSSGRNPSFRKVIQAYIDVLALTGTDYEWASRKSRCMNVASGVTKSVSLAVNSVEGKRASRQQMV